VACGYTGPITVEHKHTITQAINLHAKLRLVPILSQLREGLRFYGLNEVLKYHEDLCEQLFVPGHLSKVKEENLRNEQEDEPGTTGREQSVRAFLQWATGQAHVPMIVSEREAFKIIINFDYDCKSRYGPHRQCYPTVNACAVALTFPTRHFVTYHDFENVLTEAIRGGFEFRMY
uniref:HECT domain-containing protein n=1 Tax=Fundulus heteroclitus TaxID=8078 RepID=A0A3Q2SV61_FUNHE